MNLTNFIAQIGRDKNIVLFISKSFFIKVVSLTFMIGILVCFHSLSFGKSKTNSSSRISNNKNAKVAKGVYVSEPARLGALSSPEARLFTINSNIDNISPFEGNLSFKVPLYAINGRGDANESISFPIVQEWGEIHVENETYNAYDYPDYNPSISGYYNPLAAYKFNPGRIEYKEVFFQYNGATSGAYQNITYYYFQFVTSSGLSMTFYDEATEGKPDSYSWYQGCPNCQAQSRGNIWLSKEGNATFILEEFDWQVGGSVSGRIITADGMVYKITNNVVEWKKDANGNKTSYGYDASRQLTSITDSLNRTVAFQYNVQEPTPYGLCDILTYKGFNGGERKIRISKSSLENAFQQGQSLKTLMQLFPDYDGQGTFNIPFNPQVTSKIWLPDGKKYEFYYNSYGEVVRVNLPTGGAYEYDYETRGIYFQLWNRRLIEKRILNEQNVLQEKLKLSPPTESSNTTSVTVDYCANSTCVPANGLTQRKKLYYHSFAKGQSDDTSFYYLHWSIGKPLKTEHYDSNGQTLLRTEEFTWQARREISWTVYTGPMFGNRQGGFGVDSRISQVKTTLNDITPNLVELETYAYDDTVPYNNISDVYKYDYGQGQPGGFLSRTHIDYKTETEYVSHTGAHLRRLPVQAWISSDTAGNNKAFLTQFEYDVYAGANHAPLLDRGNTVGHDTASYGISSTRRGNVTAVMTYGNAQNQTEAITTYSQYDILGNVVKKIDGKGYISTVDYSDRFGLPDSEARGNIPPTQLNGQSTFAFPTSTTNPLPFGWTNYTQFDYFTGAVVNAEDINGIISKTLYNDLLDRPTQIVSAVGLTNYERQTTTVYDDENRRIQTTSDLNALNDDLLKTESFYDGLGRTTESRRYESDGNFITIKTIPFVMVQDPQTLIWRAATQVSNPYRPNVGEQPVWTTSLSDSLGRVIKVITPDGAIAKTEYGGNAVTVTDQALKQRRSIKNALGQLKEVHEPNNAGQLGTIGSPNQPTYYSYNVLGNLLQVQQNGTNTEQCGGTITSCTQTRTFQYDSLSRLKEAQNPESGTIKYTYDANSNLQTKRDARGIKTVYDYDNLNRVVKRCYRNIGTSAPLGMTTCVNNTETPEANTTDVAYTYENTVITSLKGVLTKVANGVSTTEHTEFDSLSRVKKSKQTTDNFVIDDMTYTYNLSGALIEQKYPSGRVVKNVLDNDGDLLIVQSKKNQNAGFFNYADSFIYTAAGAVSSMQFGNGTWESTIFNSRLQPTQIALGAVQNATDKLKLNFVYGTTNNNGNVLSQTITVPTETRSGTTYNGFTATQTYTYDSLNRLKLAEETTPNQAGWKQTFLYDRYGNRRFDTTNNNTTTLEAGCAEAVCNPQINVANNRLIGTTYDNAGNTTVDAANKTFIYDAENKQVEVKNSLSQTIGQYFYDGDGKRVKKVAGAETTVFIYDASGKLVAEYSTAAPVSQAKISYLTTDHLGSPRINTDANGVVTARHDYRPFGEEIARASYGADNVRKQFTSYERDVEIELDFAQARYYNPRHGRFTTADEPFADQWESNPQSWSLYAYVRNNPLNLVDPLGMAADCPPGYPEGCYQRDGKYYHLDKDGVEREIVVDNEPVIIETKEEGTSNLPTLFQAPVAGVRCDRIVDNCDPGILPVPMGGVVNKGIGGVLNTLGKLIKNLFRIVKPAAPFLRKIGATDAKIFKLALEKASERSGSYMDNLTSLSEAVSEVIPAGQLYPLGNINGSPVSGGIRTGVGIVEQNGKTLVVQKVGLGDSDFKILGTFSP